MQTRAQYLRPSGAARWSKCLGAAALAEKAGVAAPLVDYEEIADNTVREDGTACHWVASEVSEARHPPLDSFSPNARPITEEMFDAVDVYHGVIYGWPNVDPVIEKPVPSGLVIPGTADGTPDAWAYNPTTRTLYVADLKFGFRFVEVWWNDQLIIYAAGICLLLGIALSDVTVVFTIVQPRSFHREGVVREWSMAGRDLLPRINELRIAAAGNHADNPMCTAGSWCHDCPARHVCNTLAADSMLSLELSYDSTPLVLTPEQAGIELKRLEDAQHRLEGRITGLQATVESFIRNKQQVPGWMMGQKEGRLAWVEGAAERLPALAKLFKVDDAFNPPKPRTPTQLKSKFPQSVMDTLAQRTRSSLQLMRIGKHDIAKQFKQR